MELKDILALPTEERQKLLADLAKMQKDEREKAKKMDLPAGFRVVSKAQYLVGKLVHEFAEIAWKKIQAGLDGANRAVFIDGVKKDTANVEKIKTALSAEVSPAYTENVLRALEFAQAAFDQTFAKKLAEFSKQKDTDESAAA